MSGGYAGSPTRRRNRRGRWSKTDGRDFLMARPTAHRWAQSGAFGVTVPQKPATYKIRIKQQKTGRELLIGTLSKRSTLMTCNTSWWSRLLRGPSHHGT